MDDVVDLVDLGVEAAARDEARELAVDELDRDAERGRHRGQSHGLVRVEELRVH